MFNWLVSSDVVVRFWFALLCDIGWWFCDCLGRVVWLIRFISCCGFVSAYCLRFGCLVVAFPVTLFGDFAV